MRPVPISGVGIGIVFVLIGVNRRRRARAGRRRLVVGRVRVGVGLVVDIGRVADAFVAPVVVILRARTLILRAGLVVRGRGTSIELAVALRIPTLVP
jgi:hypothetical protein